MPSPSRVASSFVLVASLVMFGACGQENGAPPAVDAPTDGGPTDGGASPPVVVTTALGEGAMRVERLCEGPGASVAVVTQVGTGYALHRVDPAGRILWSKALARGDGDRAPFVARGRPDRVVLVETVAAATFARAYDDAGAIVAEVKLPGPLLGLFSVPKGGVLAVARSASGADVLVTWAADATAPREAVVSPQPTFADYEHMGMDGNGVLWGAGSAANGDRASVMRLEPSGAWKLLPIVDASDEVVGLAEGGAVMRALSPPKIVRLSAAGEVVSEREVADAFSPQSSDLLVSPAGLVLRTGVYDRPTGGAGALGTAAQLNVTDVDGRRSKELLFTYRGELGAFAVAAGKVWLGGSLRGSFAIGAAKVTSGPSEAGAPLLVGFDAYDTLVPQTSLATCRAFTSTCDACRTACTVCGSTLPCVIDRAIVCACRSPEDLGACIGTGFPSLETERAIRCFTVTCAEACGVAP